MNGTKKQITKMLSIMSCALSILALYVVQSTPTSVGYEFSIYEAYPTSLWVLIFLSYGCGIFIYMSEILTDDNSSNLWSLGFFAILITNAIILLLPYFRGYFFCERGDTLIHLARIKDMLAFGHLNEDNIYPLSHILGTILSIFTQVNINIIGYILVIVFPLLYFVNIVLLSKVLSKNKKQSIMIIAFGSPLVFAGSFTPYGVAFSLLPLVYYIFFKHRFLKKNMEYAFLTTLCVITISIFHPLTGLYLLLSLLSIQVVNLISKNISNKYHLQNSKDEFKNIKVTNIILVAFTSWYMWFSSFRMFDRSLLRLFNTILKFDQSQTTRYISIIEKSNISTHELLEIFLKMYGQYIIYCILTVIICIYVFKNIQKKLDMVQLELLSVFILFSIILIMYAFSNMIITYSRMLIYLFFAASIINGRSLFDYFEKISEKDKRKFCTFIVIILMSSQIFVLFNLYPSPYIKMHNFQVTESDIEGVDWFLTNRNETLMTNDIIVWTYRLATFVRGYSSPRTNLPYHGEGNSLPPDHFNYSEIIKTSNNINDRYLVINKISEQYYTKLSSNYPSMIRFSQNDFRNLNNDPKRYKIYSNGELKIYKVVLTTIRSN